MSAAIDYAARAKALRAKFYPPIRPVIRIRPEACVIYETRPGPFRTRYQAALTAKVAQCILLRDTQPPPSGMTMREHANRILRDVAVERGIGVGDLLGSSRKHIYAHARHEAMLRVTEMADAMRAEAAVMRADGNEIGAYRRAKTAWSTVSIGRFFGVDHSSVINGVASARKRRAQP